MYNKVLACNYLGSRSLKRIKPHLKMVSLKSGSLHPRVILGSPYHEIIKFMRQGTGHGFGPGRGGPFLVPQTNRRSQEMDLVARVFTIRFKVLRYGIYGCLLQD